MTAPPAWGPGTRRNVEPEVSCGIQERVEQSVAQAGTRSDVHFDYVDHAGGRGWRQTQPCSVSLKVCCLSLCPTPTPMNSSEYGIRRPGSTLSMWTCPALELFHLSRAEPHAPRRETPPDHRSDAATVPLPGLGRAVIHSADEVRSQQNVPRPVQLRGRGAAQAPSNTGVSERGFSAHASDRVQQFSSSAGLLCTSALASRGVAVPEMLPVGRHRDSILES
jgi:hypothetical protein